MIDPEKNFFRRLIDTFSNLKASFDRLLERIGWLGAALLLLLATGGFIWWNWKDLANHPSVEWVLAHFSQKPLPTAPAGRFTIAVAHLAHDNKDREQERLLLDELRQFEPIAILSVDRTMDPDERDKKKAEKEARDLLRKTGADVLIWGSVVTLSGRSAMRLNWTSARDVLGTKANGKYQFPTETFVLPPESWGDLKQIVGLLTQSFGQRGYYIADKLAPLIAPVRALVESREGVWNPETLAGVQFSLAAALWQYGDQSGNNGALAESIALYRKVLDNYTRERAPLYWAMTQNGLGNVLVGLGEREGRTDKLNEAVAAYREALKEGTRERVPLDWAQTQNDLGNALRALGGRESGTDKLDEAVAAYREALKEGTRERVPLD